MSYIKCDVCMDNTRWLKRWKGAGSTTINLCNACLAECAGVPWRQTGDWVKTAIPLEKNRLKRAANILRHGDV